MKIKTLCIIILISATLIGCESGKLQKPHLSETVNAAIVSSETTEDKEDQSEEDAFIDIGEEKVATDEVETEEDSSFKEDNLQELEIEEKKYIGQALDTLERDGIVEVYEEKSKKSRVIYKMEDLEEIELIETLPYGWFKVKLEDGQEGYVDSQYLRTEEIPPHEYNEDVEGYVLVFTHEDQTLRIYQDGGLVLEAEASSGLWDHFTPRGIFQIEKGRRGAWFYTPRFKQGGKYWVGFRGVYLFHSIPYTKDGEIIEEEAEKLGEQASHGCIRLPLKVAKYIYEEVPEESLVLIY